MQAVEHRPPWELVALDAREPISFAEGLWGLHLYSSTVTGHTPKVIIGPHSTKIVRTGMKMVRGKTFILQSHPALVIKSVFIPGFQTMMAEEEIMVPIFNGGIQSCFLEHGQLIGMLRLESW